MNFTHRHRTALMRIGKTLFFTAAILCVTKLTLISGTLTNASTVAFSFLIIVLLSAFFGDLLVAIVTSISATICFDYFYLPPIGTFTIAAFPDWISLAAFLLTTVIISRLTAAAAENKTEVDLLNKTHTQVKRLGDWLLSMPQEQLTLAAIAKEVLNIFSLEYCSIHVYEVGKWHHFTGTATTIISQEIQNKLTVYQDHPTELLELANEDVLGTRFKQINKGAKTIALLAIKSSTLPNEALDSIAYMIGPWLTLN
jgi:K+-sensing histidine kinase KdpD